MPTVEVSTRSGSYTVCVEPGALARASEVLAALTPAPTSAVVVTHPGLVVPYAAGVVDAIARAGTHCHLVEVPPGERHKTLATVARLYERLVALGVDRRGVIVSVGGGVLGDVCGFAAATYLRGVRIVQAPTTLLAQVDAAVGGKTGVDLPQGKNLVGAFKHPVAVLADVSTLVSLPARQVRSGLAEVIKHGIIRDGSYLREVAGDLPHLLRRRPGALTSAVHGSCRIKADVVAQDETEQGVRAVLNFGHTVGHALEAVTGFRRYTHGEAVAIGMVSATLIGEELGVTSPDSSRVVMSLLASARLPLLLPDIEPDVLVEAMLRDKKTTAGRLTFALVTEIGNSCVRPDVPVAAVRSALRRHRGLGRPGAGGPP